MLRRPPASYKPRQPPTAAGAGSGTEGSFAASGGGSASSSSAASLGMGQEQQQEQERYAVASGFFPSPQHQQTQQKHPQLPFQQQYQQYGATPMDNNSSSVPPPSTGSEEGGQGGATPRRPGGTQNRAGIKDKNGFILQRGNDSHSPGGLLPHTQPGSFGNGVRAAGIFLDQSSKTAGTKNTLVFMLTFVVGVGILLAWLGVTKYFIVIAALSSCGVMIAKYISRWVLDKDDGTADMREVSDPIFEGSQSFLRVQYTAIARLAGVVAFLIFLSYKLRPESPGGEGIGSLDHGLMGTISAISFILGALCSAIAGYVSMWVSAHANIRVASAAKRSYLEAMIICFRGGAFSSILVIAMCVAGISILHGLLHYFYVSEGGISAADVPLLTVGYGFGASFVALFMQLGGGIYTKAADIGADLVGKIEAGIPEDDPRNPAVIADLVGDMVGDCVGSSADIFESVAAEIIGAMILGGSLAREGNIADPLAFVYFPLMIHAFDILVSSVGVFSLGNGKSSWVADLSGFAAQKNIDPMTLLKRGYLVAIVLAFVCFMFTCWWMLYSHSSPNAWLHFAGCGIVGMITSYVFVLSTQYYTDYQFDPVQSIARASETGHGTNIITGVSVGMISTCIPVLMVSVSVISSYWLGRTSGVGSGHSAGLFGTAVATMGMLSSAAFVLAMNNYGPIADNAGGIVEMSGQSEEVRASTDMLDAAGNVTKAITKGYSIGSAALACFLLFGALLDEFSAYSHLEFRSVDITTPEVLIGGLLGVMMIFFFVGLTIAAVGRTAGEVVKEVRRQLKENPDIIEWKSKPNYAACVSLVTQAALKEMVLPGVLTVVMPVTIGLLFRAIGDATSRPLLGAEVLCSFVMFATVTGILMALFLDNVGGAWDNAKKYVESGHCGGKHSEAHKAAITGDTVGDPFKDTAGPALHVVIKLLSTTILVLAPMFVGGKS